MVLAPRAVLVHRRTELDELIDRHGTRGQAEFFLRTRGRSLAEVQHRHDACVDALRQASRAIPVDWRRGSVDRADLDRFLFDPDDVVIVVGQDGLVANTAKYLAGQPVLGLNPEPDRNPGVLVKFDPEQSGRLLKAIVSGRAAIEKRTLVRADVDDGQQLVALNEIYLGHPSHQSARYRLIEPGSEPERQSSSGVIVGTGTGATGWCASIVRGRRNRLNLPSPDARTLAWFVREAWPSPATGTTHTEGLLAAEEHLTIDVESDGLVIFGDGLEGDRLAVTWGQEITLGVDSQTLRLVSR
ncbi:MAG TPA: hypothetical protein VK585_17945 [Jiangellaceae bacterium]|nr:hypothetical protein [Jiangellaceae bacterium]